MEWRRSGQPGSAFRGLTKPRGNGRGGGKPVRGGGRGNHHAGSERTDKDVTFSVTAAGTLSATEASPAPSEPVSPGRIGRQKAPRRITTATSEESLRPSPSQTLKSPNRRRRSNQGNKVSNSTSSPTTNRHLAAEPNERRAVTGPSTPSTIAKDLPPHLAPSSDIPSFDIRNNVNALVERVRAVAMDRPRTPGSHIDWAGDDDDSLPDLDDWGVPSSKGGSVHDEPEKISPILEDTELTPLPNAPLENAAAPSKGVSSQSSPVKHFNAALGTSQIVQKQDSCLSLGAEPVPEATTRAHKIEKVRSKRGTRSRGNSRAQQVPPTTEVKETVASEPHARSHSVLPSVASLPTIAKAELIPILPPTSSKLPLHPSLPPKPVSSIEHVRIRGQSNAASATPMRNLPAKPLPTIVVDTLVQVEEINVTEAAVETVAPEETNSDVKKNEEVSVLVPLPEPLPRPKTTSPHAFNPSHGRAHTLGRLGDVQSPHSAPTSVPGHTFRHDNSNHLKTFSAQHTRNHSSPPAGHGLIRTPHPTRPVLTGDALSRLARTLGSREVSPRRDPTTVPSVKD
jgi:hypothetical protein